LTTRESRNGYRHFPHPTDRRSGATVQFPYGLYQPPPIGYANPDAVTQIANGLSTTTYAYDNDGNLISSGNGTATTTYTYDYANRLIALFAGGATTTYGYDAFGARVIQTGTSTTTLYPFKWYSVASSTGTGAKYSTTTSYMFNGDTLLATVDQQLASGVATGTAKTRYVHPDHLGSTNVVTDENDNLVQTLDYYPYGATRISVSTSTNEKRKYIDQFADDSGLSYLNARYYNPTQGQFLSEDPVFLALGSPSAEQLSQQKSQTILSDPQQLNSYTYKRDNPVKLKDPNGLTSLYDVFSGRATWNNYQVDVGTRAMILSQESPAWNFAFSHPYKTGLVVGALSAVAANSALSGAVAVRAAARFPAVGGTYAAKQAFAGLYYSTLTLGSMGGIPGAMDSVSRINFSNPSTAGSSALSLTFQIGPTLVGGYTSSISDIVQFLTMLNQGLNNLRTSGNKQSTSNQSSAPSGANTSGGSTSGTGHTATPLGNSHTACGTLCL
jgi:RHS repeat-associated protein